MNSLLETLRQETKTQHEALHVHPLLAPLTSNDITLPEYVSALQAFHHAYKLMEAQQRAVVPGLPDAPTLEWLGHDLQQQGAAPRVLRDVPYPAADTPSKRLGYLYVKQGSTLGGQVISRNLERRLGLAKGTDNMFFAGYGDKTGQQWKAFLLASVKLEGINVDEAAAQAVASFDAIGLSCDAVLQQIRTS